MILATIVMLFQAPTVPVTTNGAITNQSVEVFYAANFDDERTPLTAFHPPVPSAAPAPAPSRFDQDGIRLLDLTEDDTRMRTMQAGFPDATSRILEAVHIPPQIEVTPLRHGDRVGMLRPELGWLVLGIAQSSAASFDAWTTNRSVAQGHTELNPMLRPVAGSPAIYAAIQIAPLLLDFIGRKMQHSENGWVRRMWWMPQTLGTVTSLGAGIHNLAVTH